jgi:hypothetical protein
MPKALRAAAGGPASGCAVPASVSEANGLLLLLLQAPKTNANVDKRTTARMPARIARGSTQRQGKWHEEVSAAPPGSTAVALGA